MPKTGQCYIDWSCSSHTGKTTTDLRLHSFHWWHHLPFIHRGINQDPPRGNHGFRQKIQYEWCVKGQIPVCSNPSGFSAIPETLLHGEFVSPATWNRWEPYLWAKFYINATENNFCVIFNAHFLHCRLMELGCFSQAIRSSFCFLHMAMCHKGGSHLALSFCISRLKFSFKTENKKFGVGDKMLQESSCCPEREILMFPFLVMSLRFAINEMLECLIYITNKWYKICFAANAACSECRMWTDKHVL